MENNGARATQSPGARNADVQRADGTPIRVLVVDDEPSLAELLGDGAALRGLGGRAPPATALGAVRAAREFRPDAVVLDMMLPDIDGLEVLRRLRGDAPDVPRAVPDRARTRSRTGSPGITAGGDDYVTKPFSLEEVLARLRGLLRRAGAGPDATSDSARGRRPDHGRGRPRGAPRRRR